MFCFSNEEVHLASTGTTLNLLKFPIMRPSSRNFTLRVIRLKQEEAMRKEAKRIKYLTKMSEREEAWQLKGYFTSIPLGFVFFISTKRFYYLRIFSYSTLFKD